MGGGVSGQVGRGGRPGWLAPLVGRAAELAALARLVERERLLSLVGAPGVGKTRLAIEVGRRVAPGFPGGVRFVDLAPIGDGASVDAAVGAALGIPEEPGRSRRDVLVDALAGEEPILVVLDNCEHVAAAAAALAGHLVTACSPVRVLTTSRTALGAPGEQVWHVPPLDLAAGVALFTHRAEAFAGGPEPNAADGEVVEAICARLDGLPLAIELTAAWSRVLAPGQILDRLNDGAREVAAPRPGRGPRHDTMTAAVEWSYRLLPAGAQRLFERLSVFAGTFDLEAIEAIEDLEAGGDVVGPLAELVDHSLVVAEREPGGPMRYGMLVPVRQHAKARLTARGDGDEVRRRHLDHYMDLASRYNPWRRDLGDDTAHPVPLDRLAWDEGNLLAALAWARRQPSDLGLRLAVACGQFFAYGGRVDDGLGWLTDILAKGTDDRRLRARAQAEIGQLAWRQGDYDLAHTSLDEALTLAGTLGDRSLAAWTLQLLSTVEFSTGQADAAAEHAQRSMVAYAACDDQLGAAGALLSRAWARFAQGDTAGGAGDMRAALEANVPFANATVAAYGHLGLLYGAALAALGDADNAEARRIHLTAAAAGIGDGGVVERSDWLSLGAAHAALEGRFHAAVRLVGGMDTWERRRGGSKMPAHLAAPFMPLIEQVFVKVGSPMGDDLWAAGRTMGWDELATEALGAPAGRSPLTPRESEIAGLVAEGLTNVEIARRLVLSRRTVESHVDHIRRKLLLGSRNEIIVWALRHSPEGRG
jgi:predicted ATPase/DNA-binding CsgD family transcriptional regulator